ncbi:hypothetical protein FGL98_03525 [Leekyejoonella antrihumi]|uniref:peptidyl-tRNA hydrolase n=1 Tax=Leekyejoonella antrihumi TaxID=1660198 RepID=A0A563E790_9MICO|nr:hypothetical protein FGL98_03525 [Leekyejoonella antrihumi]
MLDPLRHRYDDWLALDEHGVVDDRAEAAQDVRALQLVVRMERDSTPSWHAAVALSASAAVAVCLDPRSAAGGAWHEAVTAYCTGHIRKVTRRARGAHWGAVQELPGITLGCGDTQVRALVPGRAVDLDKRVSRLQVGGTDAPHDGRPVAPDGPTLRMWLPPQPPMTLGKSMAQTGHAAMIGAALLAEADPGALARWAGAGYPAYGIRADATTWRELAGMLADPQRAWRDARLLAVRDAGFTEIAPGTLTVIAQAPASG